MPSPKQHKIYFDHGTETLDSMYASLQLEVDAIMKQKKIQQQPMDKPFLARTGSFRKVLEKQVECSSYFFIEEVNSKVCVMMD